MTFYRAAVRAGGPILFSISLVVFLITFLAQVKMGDQMTYTQYSGAVGDGDTRAVFLFSALATALSNAAYIFFAACILERADRFLASRGAAE